MFSKISVLGLLLLFLGCTAEKEESPRTQQPEIPAFEHPEFPSIETENVFVYKCATDSLQFTSYVSIDSTWLFLADSAVKLNPAESASGAKYASGTYIYWRKGEEALLQIPNEPLRSCQSIPQEKSWQAAKIRGVDFRALGQEPGWFLEIYDDKQIRYVGNYGEDTVYTSVPDLKINKNKTVYYVENEDHELTVEIVNESCSDSMSGFKFPATVSVSIDGETYRGCGKAL